jgi:YVTN family beta-propeller protein
MRGLVGWITVAAMALAGAVSAQAATTLPLHGLGRIVDDPVHHRVFISGGSMSDSTIYVTDEAGKVVTTIPNEPGASGMALSGSTLYVALCGQGSISVIDTATATQVDSITAPGLSDSCDIALLSGRLWYSTARQWGQLRTVDVAAPHTVHTTTAPTIYGALFATSPALPNTLVIGEAGLSPASVMVYDVSGAEPVQTANQSNIGTGGNLGDLTLSPDGSTLYIACGAPYYAMAFALSDLTSVTHSYATGPYPNAIAVTPAGDKVIAGAMASYADDVFRFPAANATLDWSAELSANSSDVLEARGLATSADGSKVFAVTGDIGGGTSVRLHVLDSSGKEPVLPKPPAMHVVADHSLVTYGAAIHLTATVGAWGAGRHVSITATTSSGGTVTVATVTVPASGTVKVTVVPALRASYRVAFVGDVDYSAATSSATTVSVRARLGLSGTGRHKKKGGVLLYRYHSTCWSRSTSCPLFLSGIAPRIPGAPVRFMLQMLFRGHWITRATGSATTGSDGNAFVVYRYHGRSLIGKQLRIQARTIGTAELLGATSPWVHFRLTR